MNSVAQLFGLGIFIFVAEKVLSETGRGDMAFIVNIGGFLYGLWIVVQMIDDISRSAYSMFRF